MNDDEIRNVYNEGNGESQTAGLRAVYEAGRKHDERERDYPDGKSTTTQGEVDARHALGKSPQGELKDPGLGTMDGLGTIRPTQGERNKARSDALALAVSQGLSTADQMKAQERAEAELVKAEEDRNAAPQKKSTEGFRALESEVGSRP